MQFEETKLLKKADDFKVQDVWRNSFFWGWGERRKHKRLRWLKKKRKAKRSAAVDASLNVSVCKEKVLLTKAERDKTWLSFKTDLGGWSSSKW